MSNSGNSVTILSLITDNRERLEFEWVAGRDGGTRIVSTATGANSLIGSIGHMNFIHPFQIQLLGPIECKYLETLAASERATQLGKLFVPELSMLIIASAETANYSFFPELLEKANALHVAVLRSPKASPHLVDVLRLYLARKLAESTTMHGVFLDVLELGVLITGASAIGKSELALELLARGHGLIADDIVELYRVTPDMVEGRCPDVLKDFLEVRGIGVLNIRTIFGETAVRPRKSLKLIIHLEDHSNEKWTNLDRLAVNATYQDVLEVPIRKMTIPVAAGRNLAVLVEAAVRNFVLNLRGIDSTREFIERQHKLIEGAGTP
jgi:HPr kinase/phosphorylase